MTMELRQHLWEKKSRKKNARKFSINIMRENKDLFNTNNVLFLKYLEIEIQNMALQNKSFFLTLYQIRSEMKII